MPLTNDVKHCIKVLFVNIKIVHNKFILCSPVYTYFIKYLFHVIVFVRPELGRRNKMFFVTYCSSMLCYASNCPFIEKTIIFFQSPSLDRLEKEMTQSMEFQSFNILFFYLT